MSVMAFASRSGRTGSRTVSSIHLGSTPRSRNLVRACAVRVTCFFIGAVGPHENPSSAIDLAELPHLLLAFLLLLQKLAFAGDVAAIAFGGDVLAQGAHGLARDHLAADRGLDRNLEHVRRDQFL